MVDKKPKNYYEILGGAIKAAINEVPDHDEDFDHEDELSVISRDYPDDFERRKTELNLEKSAIFKRLFDERNGYIDELSNLAPELTETIVKRINTADSQIIEIIKWFVIWSINLSDDMISFKTYKSLHKHLDSSDKPQKEVKMPITSISKSDAINLLRKLEDPEHTVTDEDESDFKKRNFTQYRSGYINKRNRKYYKEAFNELREQRRLSHDNFLSITNCPSVWYKPFFLRSFTYHCENKNGQFFLKCIEREFKSNSQLRRENSNEIIQAFTLV